MLRISNHVTIALSEIEFTAIRSQGAGGQNVNKVSSAIHLRFDINASSLPTMYKQRLLAINDSRLSKEGVIVLKAQRFRTQELNRVDALQRLLDIIKTAMVTQKVRHDTKPTKGSQKKRLDRKTKQGQMKVLRGRVEIE